jgi:hypothetical protein
MTAAWSLAPDDEPETLFLRPAEAFWRPTEPPLVARARRQAEQRQPPGVKHAAKVARQTVWRNPLRTRIVHSGEDLLAWREPVRRGPARSPAVRPKRALPVIAPPAAAPVRSAALQVWSPRKLRPGARPRSLGLKPLTSAERRQLHQDERVLRRWGVLGSRPTVLGDCEPEPGPCPHVSCRANLYLEVDEDTGAVKLNFPDKEVWELAETCAFKVVARRGALSLEEVGKLLNLTQERVSQIEEGGTDRLKRWARGRRRG